MLNYFGNKFSETVYIYEDVIIHNFSKVEVLLGTKDVKPMYNFIFILGKKYINACKYGNVIPNLYGFTNVVNKIQEIERNIATRKKNWISTMKNGNISALQLPVYNFM